MKIWEFFENMGESVYVSDMETHELVYMNKKALQAYGLASVEDTAGRKCYEVLKSSSMPCSVCTNPLLKEGEFVEWRYFNPQLGRAYGLKDTILMDEGRRLHLNIAFNASRVETSQSGGYDYQFIEKQVNEAIRVAMKASSPNYAIGILLDYIGKICSANRTYIFERNADGNDDNTYEWVASGITPEKDNLQNVPAEVCAGWYECFAEGKKIVITDKENIRESDPLVYAELSRQNITSIVVEPLYDNHNKVLGFFGVDDPKNKNLEYITDLLQIMGNFIVSLMMSRNLIEKLHAMANTDQLTGFGNRHAMSSYIREISAEESVGVIYCDITGLKRVNDMQGHEAGDRLILRACSCLSDTFGNHGLFRIGGDELLVICKGVTETEFNVLVQRLRDSMPSYSVVMAAGTVWHSNGGIDVDNLLDSSETLMRLEKEEYYRTSGIERRK